MAEETCGEIWQREMKDGVPITERVRRAIHEFKVLIVLWILVLSTFQFVASHFGWTFMKTFMILLMATTFLKIVEVQRQKAQFNGMMRTVMSMKDKDQSGGVN